MSRAKRLDLIRSKIDDLRSEVEDLSSELEEWRDNMPENLRGGEKYEALEEAILQLADIINNLEEASGTDVEFPGMF